MSADPFPRERRRVRIMRESLRKLLAAEKPAGLMAILQDIGNIGCDPLIATDDEFQALRRSLKELLQALMGQGIINPRNCVEFIGEPE